MGREIERVLKKGLQTLERGERLETAMWKLFSAAMRSFVRRGEGGEDLVQGFYVHLLEERKVLGELCASPEGELAPRVGRVFKRYAYASRARSQTGKLRKALSEVLRQEDPRFELTGGRIRPRGRLPAGLQMPLSPFHPGGQRFDHARLATGVALVAHEGRSVGRAELAHELARLWELESLEATLPANDEHDPLETRALRDFAEALHGSLSGRERGLLADAAEGLPLRTADERHGLGISTAHGVRQKAQGKVRELAEAHGLSPAAVLRVL